MKKWLLLFFIFILFLISVGINTYHHAFNYQKSQSNKAILVALETEPDLEVSKVTFYNGNSSYSLFHGEINNNNRIVCVPNDSMDEVIIFNPENGITAEDAIEILQREQNPLEVKSVTLGIEQNSPIWEIVYLDQKNRYSYYYVTFKDGQFIKRYTL